MRDNAATSASHPTDEGTTSSTTAGSPVRGVLEATLHFVNEKLSQKTGEWAGDVEDYEASRGSVERAGYEGVKAEIIGQNPVWAAIKGAWAGASAELKLAAILVVLLMVVLAPIPMLLLALGLLIAAIVKAVQSPRGDRA